MSEPIECLVKRMRDAQRRYFKTRTLEALETSRTLEKEVDRRIEEATVGIDLFGGMVPTNFEALTGDRDTFANWFALHAMCDFCPARFGTCQEQTDRNLCRLNWREWLDKEVKEPPR